MSRPLNFLDCKLCLVKVSDLSHARLVQYVATVIFLVSLCSVRKCICVVVTSYIHLTTSENTKYLATYLRMNSLEWPDPFIMQGYYRMQAHIYTSDKVLHKSYTFACKSMCNSHHRPWPCMQVVTHL